MGLFDNGRSDIRDLIRREVRLHLQDGETTIQGFALEFYPDAIQLAKPALLVPGEKPSELGGEALVFRNEIKFVQLLGD